MRNFTLVSNFVMNLLCLAAILSGVIIALSPFYLEAGLVGWYNGYKFNPATNILGLQSFGWLVCNVLSFLLGAAIAICAGFVGISLGITSAIIRLADQRRSANESPPSQPIAESPFATEKPEPLPEKKHVP
jgi:hypothetical protein